MPTHSDTLSPDLFLESAIDPETVQFNALIERALAAMPSIHTLAPTDVRAAQEAGTGIWRAVERDPKAQDRSIPGPAGALPIRVIVPEGEVRGVYLHLHGGGWTIGAAHHSDLRNAALAREAGLAVVSVNYRLAPEHPWPAGPDDCEAAALWLVQHAQAEFGATRLAIGGESAGAHLALLSLLRLRDRHGLSPFAAANLLYGAYDLGFTPSVRRWGDRNLVLSTPIIEWFTDAFVPDRARRADPDVSPLLADLRGLPPALFTIGTLDPLLDDSLFLWSRWLAAGNTGQLAVWPGGIHAFDAFPTALGRAASARCRAFVGEQIGRS